MKRLFLTLVLLLMAASLLPPAPTRAAGEVPKHVLLIDGSGSMEDQTEKVFLYSSGKLQALVRNLLSVEGAFGANDEIAVGIFSKVDSARGLKSPVWVYKGPTGAFRTTMPKLEPLLGWTDLVASLDAGVTEVKNHKGPQFVWLLTDNIDQATDATKSTEQFYLNLAGRSDLHRIYVFPVDVGEKNGLVLYGMARERSSEAIKADGDRLDQAVKAINASPLRPQLGDGGFLVRPLAENGLKVEIVSFTPDKEAPPEADAQIDPQTNTITLWGFDEGQPIRGQFKLVLTSNFPALKIVDANIDAELADVSSPDFMLPEVVSQQITPTKVTLEPGQKAEYTVDLNIEPPLLLFNALKNPMAALEDEGKVTAQIRLVIRNVTFAAMQPDKFFKVQRIPEILGNQSHQAIYLTAPLTAEVALDPTRPLALLGFLVAVVLVMFLIYKLTFGWRVVVRVHSTSFDKTESLKAGKSLEVPHFGFIRAKVGGLVFVPTQPGEPKVSLNKRNGQIMLKDGRSFMYEVGVRKAQRGGHTHARTGSHY